MVNIVQVRHYNEHSIKNRIMCASEGGWICTAREKDYLKTLTHFKKNKLDGFNKTTEEK